MRHGNWSGGMLLGNQEYYGGKGMLMGNSNVICLKGGILLGRSNVIGREEICWVKRKLNIEESYW